MAIITRTQSGATGAGTSGTLIYAPPPSTVAFSPNAPLFAPSSTQQPRFSGNTSARSHTRAPRVVYPEHYNQRYTLPSGIEEQPF